MDSSSTLWWQHENTAGKLFIPTCQVTKCPLLSCIHVHLCTVYKNNIFLILSHPPTAPYRCLVYFTNLEIVLPILFSFFENTRITILQPPCLTVVSVFVFKISLFARHHLQRPNDSNSNGHRTFLGSFLCVCLWGSTSNWFRSIFYFPLSPVSNDQLGFS